jgi:hypothetical protein
MNQGGKKTNLERSHWHMAGVGEELLLGTLFVVTLTWRKWPNVK